MKKIISNNGKFIVAMLFVIILGVIGITYAISIGNFNEININSTAADISYSGAGDGLIVSTGDMLPIDDEDVSIEDTDDRVVKVTFDITGVDSNPTNSIYDIAIHDIVMDCELASTDLKWRLYRGSEIINEGSLSPSFDTMPNNRLVLTGTQESLTTDTKSYTFLLWISESCTGDIAECDSSLDQSKYLNKSFSGTIKIELATGSGKTNTRTTSDEDLCAADE